MIGVIKADAYGHGLPAVAKALSAKGVKTLAVANIFEARTASFSAPRSKILLLSPLLREEIPEVVRHSYWIPTLSNLQELAAIEKEAMRQRKQVAIHLKLDTGMGRLGGFPLDTLSLLKRMDESRCLTATGLYTHFSSADIDKKETLRQFEKLKSFCRLAREHGISVPAVHLQNSAGLMRIRGGELVNGVRPGLALYGIPHPLHIWKHRFGSQPLKPVLTWKTRIALLRTVPAGTPVSYAGTHRTRRESLLAVLSAGYADGIPRKLSNRGEVLIHGKRCRILGRVTMDMTVVDVTRVPNVRWGDTAVLIGKQGNDEITAHEFSGWAETNEYEALCNIGRRVPRIIL